MSKITLNGVDYAGGSSGGSGGHTIVDPTGTDMPQENKLKFTGNVSVSDDSANGQTVVDIEGGGNYYLNTIYSTEEKKVGYWTDGKPLYQRSWTGTKSTSNDEIIINDPPSIDTLANSFVTFKGRTGSQITQYYRDANDRARVWLEGGDLKIHMDSGASYPVMPYTYTVTLQYTKTTDTADPNPQTGGVIYLPTIYSEEEREVGVWRDNKPLYQKTIPFAVNLSSGQTTTIATLTDAETIVSQVGYFVENNIFYAMNDMAIRLKVNASDELQMYVSSSWSGSGYITIQYTKTTDVAGSGNWNTDGVPTHHYSTSEQVIGTWIDGKPLYEITVDVPNPSNDTNEHLIDLSALSIEECPYLFGYAIRHSGSNDITYYANSIETDGWYYFKARYDNFRDSIMYTCLFRNDSISRMRFTIQYTKSTD